MLVAMSTARQKVNTSQITCGIKFVFNRKQWSIIVHLHTHNIATENSYIIHPLRYSVACVVFNIYSPQNNNIPDSTISYHCTIPNQIHGCKQNNYILFLSTLIQTPQLFRNGGCRLKMKNTYWLHHQSITYSISYLSLDCIYLAADYICRKAGSIFKEMLCAVPHNKHSLQPVLSCNRHENLILQNGSCNVSHTTCLFAL